MARIAVTTPSVTSLSAEIQAVDPVVKGLARCTGTTLAAEVSVSRSDTDTMDDSLQASMSTAPKQQKTLSMNIVPDNTFYTLKLSYRFQHDQGYSGGH